MIKNDLQQWLNAARQEVAKGNLPNYIPLLAQADPQAIAIAIQKVNGDHLMAGDTALTFPLMSVIKPFLLLYLLETKGAEQVFQLVNRQATSEPFNAIPKGKPKNSMINSGAIALSSLLESCGTLQNWLNQRSGTNLTLDLEILASVRSVANRRNLAIADQLKNLGLISNPRKALAVYEEICCLRGNVQDLAKIGTLLVYTQRSSNIPIVLEIMTKCGMYESSTEFAQNIGVPSKSSISGALLSIIPDQAAIACYSPALDATGNSVSGLFLIRKIKNYVLGLGREGS
ncbi:glutaminase [Pseudanabaena sp. lw0831]|uniref:glutaminase n=1 Tax=Pseudanabaena sp. lw0831 TaxID=1357935 RepID=UPI0019159E24|nr:glutaminase [Pseudanabaena sp. lw0831]GBO55890.1 glutaminase [Pseudanabaena sp. lw0831]